MYKLTDEELNELMKIVKHPMLVAEVRRRFKHRYVDMAMSFYSNEYHNIGNITEGFGK